MMALNFRPAHSHELGRVCQLYQEASQNPFSVWDEEYPSRLEAEQDFATENLFVLTDDDTVIGALSIVPEREMDDFPVWTLNDGTQQEIARITISQEYQGKGLAAVMVQNILAILKERGCHVVRLSAASCNIPAYKTYRKLGFQLRGEKDMFGSHYYLLEKIL